MGILVIVITVTIYILVAILSIYGIYIGYQILYRRNYQLPKLICEYLRLFSIIFGKEKVKQREKELSSKSSLRNIGIIAIISSPFALWFSINALIRIIKILNMP